MTKVRATDLVKRLRDAAREMDPIARAAIELVQVMGDTAKDTLVSADGDDMLRAQGEARVFRKLLADLTTIPPNITETTR